MVEAERSRAEQRAGLTSQSPLHLGGSEWLACFRVGCPDSGYAAISAAQLRSSRGDVSLRFSNGTNVVLGREFVKADCPMALKETDAIVLHDNGWRAGGGF